VSEDQWLATKEDTNQLHTYLGELVTILQNIRGDLKGKFDKLEDSIRSLEKDKADKIGLIEIEGDLPVAGAYEIENLVDTGALPTPRSSYSYEPDEEPPIVEITH
jgi:hypothetical protein